MNVRRALIAVLPFIAGALVVGLWPKQKRSPEDEVRALIASAIAAAEKRDVAGVTETLSEPFRGGGLTRQELKQYVAGLLLRSPDGLTVLNPALDITVESPTSAAFKGTFIFSQGPNGANSLGKYDISGRASKLDDRWKLDSAEWSR